MYNRNQFSVSEIKTKSNFGIGAEFFFPETETFFFQKFSGPTKRKFLSGKLKLHKDKHFQIVHLMSCCCCLQKETRQIPTCISSATIVMNPLSCMIEKKSLTWFPIMISFSCFIVLFSKHLCVLFVQQLSGCYFQLGIYLWVIYS